MIHTINKGEKLYKTADYPCESILEYMKLEPSESCKSNKMIWLSETRERAESYQGELKRFTTTSDIELWNLMDESYSFLLDNYIDKEFKGKMQSILRLFGESQTLSEQAFTLYGFLTGSGIYSVRIQHSILKDSNS